MGINGHQNPRGYTHHALFPQVMISLVWGILEVSFLSLALSIIIGKTHIIIQKNWGILIIVVFFSILEIIRRLTFVSEKTYHLFVKIFALVKKELYKASLFFKTRRALLFTYMISNFVFLMLIAHKTSNGLEIPMTPLEEKYLGLMNNAITLSTITLVIFFAVIVAIIQNVSKDFSGEFLKIVLLDSIFVSGVLIILLLNFGFLSILRFGSNEHLISASFIAACYIIVTFIILLVLTVYYLSIPNIIQTAISRTTKFIVKKVPNAPTPLNGTVLLAEVTKTQKLQLWLARWIFGSVRFKKLFELGVAKREVDTRVIEEIESRLRPFGSAMLTAIEKDRHEVFMECLRGFENAVRTYMGARKNYIGGIDQLNLFILSQYEAALQAAIKSPNQQFTEDISHSASIIGKSTLILETITVWGKSNDHVGIWTEFLRKVALNTFHLKHTGAPMVAAGEIGNIAQILISKKLYNTAVYGVSKHLSSLGVFLVETNQFFSSNIAARCISGLMNQLFTFLFLSSKGEHQDSIYIKSVSESISNIIRSAKETKVNTDNYDAIIAPLVSTLWIAHLSPNIPQLTERVLNLAYKDEESELETIRLFKTAFENFGWVARYTYQIKTVHSGGWVAQAFSESAYYVLSHLFKNRKSGRTKQEAIKNLLVEIVKSLSDALSFSFRNKDTHNKLENFSAMPALILFFAKFREIPQIIDIYKIPLERLIKSYESMTEDKDPYGHTRREIRSHIQLFGSWLYLCFPSSKLAKSTSDFLKENKADEEAKKRMRGEMVPEMVQLGYPHGQLLSETWFLYPSEHWHSIQFEVNQELNKYENYRAYSKLVNS